ncbi:MAG: glucosaminidase domain-containing protein [Prevotellaceae bacterium]|nr:glucosaminidase domain-containing protein [Prevotellaceae bacterium]
MGKNAEYAAQYAAEAKEQMKRYGIPASVILAQGILESSNGQSELSRNCNNHFGIKATASWLRNGGEYALYTDDKPNEKFCKYKTVGDSYEHHSQFLKNNSRYARCFELSPDDYKGWTRGIEKAGYATGGGYAASLQRIIEANGLDRYDKEVMQEMRAEGRTFGVEGNPREDTHASDVSQSVEYSFPVKREEFLFVTSPFGNRQDPMNPSGQQMHKGIDIKTSHDAVLATENGGKIVAVNHNANTAGGKSVTVEYTCEDGGKVQCSYLHLSDISVKVGDTVRAGQELGVSGNTGTRTTGEHLHFGVKAVAADGTKRDMDPAAYLAEIGQKGNIKLQALHNGNDLLAKYKSDMPQEQKTSSEDWMKKLLSSEDSGVGISGTNDPILDMAMTTFMSLMMLAAQIDSKDEERQKGLISAMAANRSVDLTPLIPGMRQCTLSVGENGRTVLQADNGTVKINRELTSPEMNRLSLVLGQENLSEESKRMKIAGMVTGIIATQQASQNFEQGMEAESQQQSLQRK